LLSQRRLLTGFAFAKKAGCEPKCRYPLRNDFGSIAATATVLRQSSEAGSYCGNRTAPRESEELREVRGKDHFQGTLGRADQQKRRPCKAAELVHDQQCPEITCHCFVALNNRFFRLRLLEAKYSPRHFVTELSMYSKSQLCDLEVMCHQRAAAARKEMDYWLAEAEEWARFRLSCNLQRISSSELTQSPKVKADV